MKKNISDLLDAYDNPDIDLKEETPLSSERIKELTMNRIKEETAPKKGRITFSVMMAAAIVVVLAVTAFAAGSGAAWFQTFFAGQNEYGLTDEQLALIEQNAVPIDQSQTVNGYTINVESVMNDEQIIYVKLDLFAPEGVELPYGDYRHFGKMALYNHDREQVNSGCGFGEPIDEDKTDNHVEILISFDMEERLDTSFLLTNGRLTLELTNLYKTYGRPLSQTTEIITEGTWHFDLTFATMGEDLWEQELISEPIACMMVKYHAGEETEIFLTSVCLRALTIDVVYDYPDGADLEPLYWLGMKVIKKDGTAINVMPSDGSIHPEGNQVTGYMSLKPNAPIVLDEVAYIEFPGGVKIYVNE